MIVQGKNMKDTLKRLKTFNWQLFAALCALSLIPTIYQTIKTFIISANDSGTAFDIIGQMEWFDLINETLQAFLIIPLYSILNKIFKNDGENFAKHVFKTGLVSFVIYALFSIGILIYGVVLIKAMNPVEIDVSTTNTYLQLETVAFMVGIIVGFINVVFVVVGKAKNVYIFLTISTVLSVISDFILIPSLGIYGIAISNIIVNSVLAIASFALLYRQKYIKFAWFNKSDLPTLKQWTKVGVFSGAQQFIDNLIYAVMVCKMVNMVAEQGNYWIANNFIWGWMLIPVTALSEVIRRDCKDGYKNLVQSNYYTIGVGIVLLWAVTIPLWIPFFRYAEHLSNADEIFTIVLKLAPFYVAYIGCAIIDNIFVGLGKTYYNAVNSLIINIIYYGVFFVLYLTKTITFTMDVIILMFGFGMVAHFVISIVEEKVFLRKKETVVFGKTANSDKEAIL